MRFNVYACILGLAFFQQAAALDTIDDTEDFISGYELIKKLQVCQNVPQEVQQTYFEMPGDLPTAKGLLCAVGELVKEMEYEEKENSKGGLEKRDDDDDFMFGCSLWKDDGCGRRHL